MPRSISKTVIIFALLFLPLQQAVSGQLEDGFVAFKQGDSELAREKWLDLAIKGDVRAQFFLSVFFEKHSASAKDRNSAKRWLTASANNGFVPAQFNLGNNFHTGKYGQINNEKAEYWWNQAAMQGFPEAQYRLATLYHRGKQGVGRNLKEALYWFEQAAKGGRKEAVDAVLLVRAGEMPPPESAEVSSNIAYDDPRIVSKLSLPLEQTAVAKQHNLPGSTIAQQTEVEAAKEQQEQDWVSLQPPNNYTIQLLASTILRDCKNYSKELFASAKLETNTQSFLKKGKRYCAVIYGSYGSYAQAKSSLRHLPRKRRKAKPWIRKIAR